MSIFVNGIPCFCTQNPESNDDFIYLNDFISLFWELLPLLLELHSDRCELWMNHKNEIAYFVRNNNNNNLIDENVSLEIMNEWNTWVAVCCLLIPAQVLITLKRIDDTE